MSHKAHKNAAPTVAVAALIAALRTMAGVGKDGESTVDAALAKTAARLGAALVAEENADLVAAADSLALSKARRALRVAKATARERAEAAVQAKLAAADALAQLTESDKLRLRAGADAVKAPKAPKAPAKQTPTEQETAQAAQVQ